MAPRFLIDENLSPLLALHLLGTTGLDAVHVNAVGLQGASDADVLAFALANDRVIVTSNADDFRKLASGAPNRPGLAVLVDAVERRQQIDLGTTIATAIETLIAGGETARGRVFEIDSLARVRDYRLPCERP